jgi:type IV pilus assembly protein PilM
MPRSVIGVDIGRRSIRAVELENADKARPAVTRIHEVALPDGAVNAGEVLEVQTVATAVRKLWSEGSFTSKNVVLGVGNQRVIARDLTVPKLASLQQVREALPFQVQDMLPVPVGDAILDFYPISESQGETGPVINGLLIAAIKEAVLANVNAVQGAGLRALTVDLIPFALTRALVRGSLAEATVVLVDVGANTTQVVVSSRGVPQFIRMIPAGGDDITRALMARLEMPVEVAEQFKAARGLSSAAPTSELEQVGSEVIRGVTHELLNGIRNTLHFYATLQQTEPFQAIILTGGGAQLPGLAQVLGEAMQLQVVSPDVSSAFELSKSVQRLGSGVFSRMTVALGLAVGVAA